MQIVAVFLLLVVCQTYAQTCDQVAISTNGTCPCPDVFLDVPKLHVGQISLVVEDLEAHVSLNAKAANLITLNAGVDVSIKKVNLTIADVDAQLQLVVRLDNVRKIVSRALDTLDKNPNILNGLIGAITDLLSSVVNDLGQLVQRTVDQLGNIVEKVVDEAGNIVSQNIVGSVLDLAPISSTVNSLGQTVLNVRDVTSGNLIEVVLDTAGKVLSTKILQ